jgi:hypothetical protein
VKIALNMQFKHSALWSHGGIALNGYLDSISSLSDSMFSRHRWEPRKRWEGLYFYFSFGGVGVGIGLG